MFTYRTQWWLSVVKGTFLNAGISDSALLEKVAWHLIKLYSTTQVSIHNGFVHELAHLVFLFHLPIGMGNNTR